MTGPRSIEFAGNIGRQSHDRRRGHEAESEQQRRVGNDQRNIGARSDAVAQVMKLDHGPGLRGGVDGADDQRQSNEDSDRALQK